MKPFEDMLPEEKEPQHEELITLLQRVYRKPVPLLPMKEAQVIERVRERLMQAELEDSTTEDILVPQKGVLDSTLHKTVSPVGILRHDKRRFRFIALFAATLVIAVLLGTPLLLLRHSSTGGTGGLPTLTLSSHAVRVGDSITFTLKHVTPSASVALTHDIQEPILINGSSSITTDKQGTAIFSVVFDKNWRPGFHQIVAEDVVTRNTAGADLQITGQDPTPPPHLLVDSSSIHMGADVVGANTIRSFNLVNSRSGSISWSASSDQSWLLISPSQGTFSQSQTISLAVQRVGLKPGDYTGSITISTNVITPQHIEVDMTVRPLPPNAGAVLALPPALLSFATTDGDPNNSEQSLTISNPGLLPLHWSLSINASTTAMTQLSLAHAQGLTCDWLSATPNTGTVSPGATSALKVMVHNHCLLPGTYVGTLKFTAAGAIDSAQAVNVSLVVQPHCGLVTSTGYVAFTAVQGQNNMSNQTLGLNATASCAGTPISWTTSSTASWLTISPASGQLKGAANTLVHIRVNAKRIMPGMHSSNIFFVTGHSTLTVAVQLTVQAAPPLASPIMGASPLSLNFSNIQGQPNPSGQVVTIANNGPSALSWHTSVATLSSWLGASPSGGTIAPGQSGQVMINVNTAILTPGSYVGQVTLNGMDAKGTLAPGSPQTITITLVVQSPCSLSPPSSSVLSFSAVQGAPNPPSQTVTFMGIGGCAWPVTWNTSVKPTANWLTLTAPGGTVKGTGQSGSIGVGANIAGLPAGTYTTKVTISASDASGATVQGSPQSFSVTLTVLPPCVLSPPSPASLAFSIPQGQSASTQNVTLSETGTCSRPVTWNASTGSNTWLVLSSTSGTDGGSGSVLGVNVNAATLVPGTYTGTITITATDSTGATVVGSPQTVGVTLTVTGYTISGTVFACPGSTPPTCTAPQALPGAAVTLMSGSTTVATTTADASGNYAFSNIALGTYTINVAGYDASNTHYIRNLPLTLTGNALNTTIQAFPG
jgi:Viral BACON domain